MNGPAFLMPIADANERKGVAWLGDDLQFLSHWKFRCRGYLNLMSRPEYMKEACEEDEVC